MTQSSTTPADSTTRARLLQARTDVIAEMGRTDAKASALLTVLGIPLAVLIAAVPGRDLPVAATVLAGIGGGGPPPARRPPRARRPPPPGGATPAG
ncbi:hypothetical protein [Streptomyces virginiae]|uniref:hypothetical protein n=1 Tax=Streptomyces virginiae TaxID=1961 RepID=UPI0037BA36C5